MAADGWAKDAGEIPRWIRGIRPDRRILTGSAYAAAKRLMDLTLVLLTAPAWLPLLGISALAVKLSCMTAPVFFCQQRTGRGGRTFKLFKLRTMVANAEALKAELARQNERRWPDFKIEKDPRITRLGSMLRKTSLDELPQLINVLRGDMSLVGPRPTSFGAGTYDLWQTERLDAKPGITGLWQVLGRGKTEFKARSRLDIAYVERRCILLDVQILARTLPAVLRQRGAE
jgi:lipopolysaccharide/colanic/teichoic acid biosynthesis glycosyltransferase